LTRRRDIRVPTRPPVRHPVAGSINLYSQTMPPGPEYPPAFKMTDGSAALA